MPDLRGLTIIVSDINRERFRTGLMLALTEVALRGRASIFLNGEAISLIHPPIHSERDAAHEAVGLPTLPDLVSEVMAAGIDLIGCQSGLALIDAEASEFDARVRWSGMVQVMSDLGHRRLLLI